MIYFCSTSNSLHEPDTTVLLQRSSAWNITTNDVFNDVMQATESTHYDHRKLLVKN